MFPSFENIRRRAEKRFNVSSEYDQWSSFIFLFYSYWGIDKRNMYVKPSNTPSFFFCQDKLIIACLLTTGYTTHVIVPFSIFQQYWNFSWSKNYTSVSLRRQLCYMHFITVSMNDFLITFVELYDSPHIKKKNSQYINKFQRNTYCSFLKSEPVCFWRKWYNTLWKYHNAE